MEGRYPSFEIRKMNQEWQDETQHISFDQHSLDRKPEIVLENVSLLNNDSSCDGESSSDLHQFTKENSYKDDNTLCVFLYGVRYHHFSGKFHPFILIIVSYDLLSLG